MSLFGGSKQRNMFDPPGPDPVEGDGEGILEPEVEDAGDPETLNERLNTGGDAQWGTSSGDAQLSPGPRGDSQFAG